MNYNAMQFLTEGLNVYPEARATVKFFENEIGDRLLNAVESRQEWLPLKNHHAKKETRDYGDGADGYWVSLAINGSSPSGEPVKIDCGIWWGALKGTGPIVHANFFNEPKWAANFKWENKTQDIQSFMRWNRTFLYLPLTDPANVDKLLNRVLDALLKQLSCQESQSKHG